MAGDDHIDEEKLLERAQAGDQEGFARLVQRYQGPVYMLGLRLLRDREEARDFTQDVFVKAFRKLHTYRGEGRFYSWLLGLGWRHGLDMLRARRRTFSLDGFEPVSNQIGPESAGLASLARQALARAIAELPERYRMCVVLFFFFELTYVEIHRMTGVPVNTVKSHVLRAKQLLRQALKGTDAEVGNDM